MTLLFPLSGAADIFTPDDIDRIFFGYFALQAGSGVDDPPKLPIQRKPGNTPLTVNVPVWYYSPEMRHTLPKEFPAIIIQSNGLRVNQQIPNRVNVYEAFTGPKTADHNMITREAST